MNNRDWVEAALMNQSVVAELLIRLKYSDPAPMRSSHGVAVDWSVRQRRSKQILKEKGEPARDSPSTPLSWRSATSASGGATDVEDSTRADKASDMRSKNIAVGESSNIRKQRKRKTFAELKEEEELLLKERNHLQMELQTFTMNLKKQRAKNEHLKRVKLGTQSPPAKKAVAPSLAFKPVADQPAPMVPTTVSGSGEYAVPHQYLPNGSSKVQAVVKKEPRFLLPDLNQPLEEDFSS
ncbi:uncharacterized protein LOC117921656 [Vitis riparia]|uniref:uncharacterized protein LOC117921656 n=1 Tax=Vitis riparia TaxID=96939 RepID=UPI00155A0C4D|nr:uncharacterized protein LOC117921656 [Vitis riparia]